MRRGLELFWLTTLLTGCNGSSTDPDPAEGTDEMVLLVSFALPEHNAIDRVVVEVTAPDINPALVFDLNLVDGFASGTITIPTGSGRIFTIRAYDAAGIETHRGQAIVAIEQGTLPTIEITLLPLVGTQPIDVTIGSFSITVTPDLDTLKIGDALRLSATVVDHSGGTHSVSVQWASLNAAAAIVDTAGVVTAVGLGEALIVASYAGVAGAATIVVPIIRFSDADTFVAATGALETVSYPFSRDTRNTPYLEHGVTLSHADGGDNQIADLTRVLPGREFSVVDAENIDVTFDEPVAAVGIWLQDGYDVGDLGGCPKHDSQFEFRFLADSILLLAFDEDPPIDEAFFLGVASIRAIDRIEIREAGDYCENDFFGSILTVVSDSTARH